MRSSSLAQTHRQIGEEDTAVVEGVAILSVGNASWVRQRFVGLELDGKLVDLRCCQFVKVKAVVVVGHKVTLQLAETHFACIHIALECLAVAEYSQPRENSR